MRWPLLPHLKAYEAQVSRPLETATVYATLWRSRALWLSEVIERLGLNKIEVIEAAGLNRDRAQSTSAYAALNGVTTARPRIERLGDALVELVGQDAIDAVDPLLVEQAQ